MIIIVNDWKKKLIRLAVAVVIIIAFAFTIPILTGLLHKQLPVGGWFQEEHPSGNPMRVEQRNQRNPETKFDQMLDQFVLKVQDFYYEE
ncbi:MAG TPA: hypothetical protein GXX58_10940 [Gelria sp.]|jgi:hypothetical protein|nr:hypothetical protein [Gelria sp.]